MNCLKRRKLTFAERRAIRKEVKRAMDCRFSEYFPMSKKGRLRELYERFKPELEAAGLLKDIQEEASVLDDAER